MNGTYNLRTTLGAKVGFLVLFALGLLTARAIVALRTAVVLSAPVTLPRMGLSIAVPAGNGWKSASRWKHERNTFVLTSIFSPRSSRPTASAQCRYRFPREVLDTESIFEREAAELDAEIMEQGQFPAGPLDVNWAHLRKTDAPYNTFFGIVSLPHSRCLEIEVHETAGDAHFAATVFQKIAESAEFHESPLLEAGRRIINSLKEIGLAQSLENRNRQGLFLIRDSSRRILGFTTEVVLESDPESQFNIEGAALDYIKTRPAREQVTTFQSDNRFDRFNWRLDRFVWHSLGIAPEKRGFAVSLGDDGVLRITTYDVQTGEVAYRASDLTIPEILLDQVLARMFLTGTDEIIVDVIGSDGRIAPTHISRIEPENTSVGPEVRYMAKLVSLYARSFFQLIYLDAYMQITKRLVRKEDLLIFEKIDPADAAKLFPERAEYILQADKLRKYREPQGSRAGPQ